MNIDQFQIKPYAKAGYKYIGLNFNLDISPTMINKSLGANVPFPGYLSLLDTYPLSFKLKDGHLATGTVGLKISKYDQCSIFGSFSTSVSRNLSAQTSEGPGIGVAGTMSLNWEGNRFQWREWEFGLEYNAYSNINLLAGLKLDSTTSKLSDPSPVPTYTTGGFQIVFIPPIPGGGGFIAPVNNPVSIQDYTGDLITELTTPYLGIGWKSGGVRASLLAGMSSARIRLPWRINSPGRYAGFLLGIYFSSPLIPPPLPNPFPIFTADRYRSNLSEEALYTLESSGPFLEANIEWDFDLTESCGVRAWAEGNWTKITADGSIELQGSSDFSLTREVLGGLLFSQTLSATNPFSATDEGNSVYRQYSLSAGLICELAF